MLKPIFPSKFIERIMTSPSGEQFRVVFHVTLVGGEVVAKVISAKSISAPLLKLSSIDSSDTHFSNKNRGNSATLFLPGFSAPVVAHTTYASSYSPIVSPFTTLLFFTSQPTRAPSF
jgi:hypothetical protein